MASSLPTLLFSLWMLAIQVTSQFVKPPTDLITKIGHAGIQVRYKEVPSGICETHPGVKSYAGYVDIDEGQHIFFWFFEARNQDPEEADLTAWISGGPGSSSMIGIFEEHGPCRVDSNGKIYDNPYSWSNVSNMIYIDHPAQVGFSYSVPVDSYIFPADTDLVVGLPERVCPDYADKCGTFSSPNQTLTANSTINAAPSFWKTLQGFMGAFPQYSSKGNGFHLTTQSYGGHYGPIFADYIVEQNAKNITGAIEIPLKTVSIGNGWYDPVIQWPSYYDYITGDNPYDYDPYTESEKKQIYNHLYGAGNCMDQARFCAAHEEGSVCRASDEFCYYLVQYIYEILLERDQYDVRQLTPDPFPYTYYVAYLNTEEVHEAIGAFQNFTKRNPVVYTGFDVTADRRNVGSVDALRKLVDGGINVMLYAGDADYNCNWLGNELIASEINPSGLSTAGYTNITTSDSITHGQTKQSGHFSFSRIYEAGHKVPFYQPLAALELFERAITGKDLATGLVDVTPGLVTSGAANSTVKHGNASMVYEVLPGDATYNTTTNRPNL